MSSHPIESMMTSIMQKIKEMIDVNTIVGEPIKISEKITLIPISKVSYGFASGGSDFPCEIESKDLFGGGSGAGITLSPVSVIVINGENVKMLQTEPFQNSIEKIIDMTPDLLEKIKNLFGKDKKEN